MLRLRDCLGLVVGGLSGLGFWGFGSNAWGSGFKVLSGWMAGFVDLLGYC